TIHKAKGLEAKFVIVFLWNSVLNSRNRRSHSVLDLTDPTGKKFQEFQLHWGNLTIQSDQYEAARKTDNHLDDQESIRLAYVAATRAQQRLLIIHQLGENITPPTSSVAKTSSVELSQSMTVSASMPATPTAALDPQRYRDYWLPRWQRAAQPPPPLWHHPSVSAKETDRDLDHELPEHVAARIRLARQDALVAGELAHRYLQLHLLDNAFDEAKWQRLLAISQSPVPSEKARALARAALERFYRSSYRQRLQTARVLAREIRFYLAHHDERWTGAMDLLLEEADRLLIVDFKLSPPQHPLPEPYKRQQRIYEAALRAQFPNRPVAMEFWWLE
ncbi:MAG: PD-(D/E)XK nuclease family protein, partial [Verrucomicrobiae bacterium]|nr:PD-(D/E)XK nuclease family protein [Verrucomicrobiae bacterium]